MVKAAALRKPNALTAHARQIQRSGHHHVQTKHQHKRVLEMTPALVSNDQICDLSHEDWNVKHNRMRLEYWAHVGREGPSSWWWSRV